MRDRPNRRNAELEAFDRALRGETGEAEPDPAPADDGAVNPDDSRAGAPRALPGAVEDAGPNGARQQDAAPTEGAPASRRAADPQTPTGPDDSAPPAVRTAPYGEAEGEDGVTTEVLARDLIIFQVKLLLDGLKDVVLSPLSIAAFLWDMIPSQKGYRGRTFYKVMKIGERFDLWLNLYTHARTARLENQGLLEAGVHSADSLMGKLEQLARTEAERQARKNKRVDDGGWGG